MYKVLKDEVFRVIVAFTDYNSQDEFVDGLTDPQYDALRDLNTARIDAGDARIPEDFQLVGGLVQPRAPKPKRRKALVLNSCLDCPHQSVEPDPSSDDSFDFHDNALVCHLALVPPDQRPSDLQQRWSSAGRRIVGYSRHAVAEYKRDGSEIPEWCPLED